MAENALAAELRTSAGKGVARKLRAAGRIPAVMYGRGKETAVLAIDPKALDDVLHKSGAGRNTLISLGVDGTTHTVLLKDLQRDPVAGDSLHADFFLVDLAQTVEVAVPLHFIGKAIGTDFGGIMDHPVRELLIECLPSAIPEFVEVDIASLEVGQTIHVRDVALGDGLNCKTEADLAVAICATPMAEEETTDEVEEGAEEAATGDDAATDTPAEGDGDN
ncbi:MAG: 50S ribosomal protein L25 [Deltaproteobacteria bacterium]|nr:50S ribosomal protein L25 [Deltaproteobacteria bacterium]MBW2394200.1 50S ribosomal protein L25 [Deltaproteobacteria bacterium]